MGNALAGHSNTYHTYSLEQALDGIARAGFRYVELTAVEGWTEHVDLDAPQADLRAKLAHYGLEPTALSGHSDLTTPEGVEYAIKAVRWCAEYGLPLMSTAIGGHSSQEENESAFLEGIGRVADAADAAGVMVALEIHGDIMATGALTVPLLERIGRERIQVAYDTGNCEFYGDTPAVEDIGTLRGHLVNAHLKDKRGGARVWDFPAIGAGHVDFGAVKAAFDAVGYTGPMSVELEFAGEPWPALADVDAAMAASFAHLSGLGYGS